MTPRPTSFRAPQSLLRLAVAGVLLYYAWPKLEDPFGFLKAVHLYGVLDDTAVFGIRLENLAAVGIPWLEVLGALALATGVMRRGAALWLVLFLLLFTGAVAWHAAGIQPDVPYLQRSFDCGCGTGVVVLWEKLVTNLALVVAVAWTGLRRP